jgi:hypothetical protein
MSEKKDSGIVNIHGKQYQTVAYRVGKFREAHQEYSLTTEIVSRDEDCVVMKATIADSAGRVLANGHSEEYRHTSQINRTSALENAETSAIGRALAALGLGGTEFASADEVANSITQQRQPIPANHGAGDGLDAETKKMVHLTRDNVVLALNENRDFDAYALCESLTDEMLQEKLYLWSLLSSSQRRRLKAQADLAKQKAAA